MKFPTKFEQFLPPAAVSKVLDLLSQPALSHVVRETLQKVGLKDANPVGQVQDAWRQARGWFESVIDRVLEQNHASPAAINASGQLFDPRWSSLPTNTVVLQALAAAAVNFQDQVRLEKFAGEVGMAATSAQAVLFVSTPSAVLAMLASSSTFRGGLVIARADVLRIPGSTDVRGILAAGSNGFTDVGAVNGTSEDEWRLALNSNQKTLLLISPNSLEGEEAKSQRAAAMVAARAQRACVVEFLFDATLDSTLAERLNFPLLSSVLSTGVDLVIAPLDGLLGGPSGALVAGREDLIESLRTTAAASGVLLQGSALAGAAAALSPANATESSRSSVTQMLLTNADNLRERSRRMAIQLNNTARVALAEAMPRDARLGPSPWHRYRLASHAVAVTPRNHSVEEMVLDLGSGKQGPAIWVKSEEGRVIVDLRFVEPADDAKVVETLVGNTTSTDAPVDAPSS